MSYKLKDVAEAAMGFIGERFVHQGRGERGYDCIGVVLASLEATGDWQALSPETTYVDDYDRLPEGAMIESYMALEADIIPRNQAGAGDVVLMRFAKEPQHLAVLVDPPKGCTGLYMVHSVNGAMGGNGVVMCSYDTKHRARTKSIWRFKGGE